MTSRGGSTLHAADMLPLAIEEPALLAWMKTAKAGQRIVYATGPVLPWAAASVVLARGLADRGLVDLVRQRRGGVWDFIATRRRDGASAEEASPPRPPADPVADDMLRLISRAANLGQPCPTNAELAARLDLPNPDAASYRFRKLIASGAIKSEEQGPNWRRIVTVTATGKTTVAGAL